jgi:hypothetical protein
MNELYKLFKKLTGFNGQDIATKYDVSRQHVSAAMQNFSITYKSCTAYWMNEMIDEKINELIKQVEELEYLKEKIKYEVHTK